MTVNLGMTKTHSAKIEIGAYGAKTRLLELLRKVKQGQPGSRATERQGSQ